MQILQAVDAEIFAAGTATVTFVFDQPDVGNSICVILVNHGKNPMTCTAVRKFPIGLTGDFGTDTAETSTIGTLAPGANAILQEISPAYLAVQYIFTGTNGDIVKGTLSVGAPR